MTKYSSSGLFDLRNAGAAPRIASFMPSSIMLLPSSTKPTLIGLLSTKK
jgi:hypothetical protein